MQTIVELPEFLRKTSGLVNDEEKANLSKAERNELGKLTTLLIQRYGESNG
ncbi:MAG: hypothetical protein WD005_03310 [Haliea sp.]